MLVVAGPSLWTSGDEHLVRRLVVLRGRLEDDVDAAAALYAVALRLEASVWRFSGVDV